MPIKINGATSGSTTITAPATGSDETIELSTALASKLPYSYGTATPSTTDSGFLWYDSNNTPPVPKYWNGSSFATLAPASGLELVTTETFSAVGSVSINGCFTSTYANYLMIYRFTTNNTVYRFRYRASGTDDTSASYSRFGTIGGSTASNISATAETSHPFAFISGGQPTHGVLTILAPALAERTQATGTYFGSDNTNIPITFVHTAVAHDGITIFPDSGTVTGYARIYGYKN